MTTPIDVAIFIVAFLISDHLYAIIQDWALAAAIRKRVHPDTKRPDPRQRMMDILEFRQRHGRSKDCRPDVDRSVNREFMRVIDEIDRLRALVPPDQRYPPHLDS